MIKRINGCKGIYERIKADRVEIGLKTFDEITTSQYKADQLPVCAMNYGTDTIIKKSSRSASPSRKGEPDIRQSEVILEFITDKKIERAMDLYLRARKVIFSDIYPLKNEDGSDDRSVHMVEARTEGPFGYGVPDAEVMTLVIALTYPDEI